MPERREKLRRSSKSGLTEKIFTSFGMKSIFQYSKVQDQQKQIDDLMERVSDLEKAVVKPKNG